MKSNALQLADTLPPLQLHVEKGGSVCVPHLRSTCSGAVNCFKALQDEGLCKCGAVISVDGMHMQIKYYKCVWD